MSGRRGNKWPRCELLDASYRLIIGSVRDISVRNKLSGSLIEAEEAWIAVVCIAKYCNKAEQAEEVKCDKSCVNYRQ